MQQGPGEVAPLLHIEMPADSVDAQARVVAGEDSLSLGAAQDFDHICNAVPLVPLREPRDT